MKDLDEMYDRDVATGSGGGSGGGGDADVAHEAARDAAALAEARAIIADNPLLDPALPRPSYVRPDHGGAAAVDGGRNGGSGDGGGGHKDDGLNAAERRAAARHAKTRGGSRLQDVELSQMVDDGMCLSMHQPWASLLVRGIKQHEGRTW
jgi:hypothetical protein